MKVLCQAIAVVALFAALASCKSAPKYDLKDGQWAMTSWNDDAGQEMVLLNNRPTMTFANDSQVHGNAGCNDFTGRYEVNGDKIKIDMGGMTLKMCLDMAVEDRMVAQMPNVTRFEIDGNQLVLFNAADKELFRFDNMVDGERINTNR